MTMRGEKPSSHEDKRREPRNPSIARLSLQSQPACIALQLNGSNLMRVKVVVPVAVNTT